MSDDVLKGSWGALTPSRAARFLAGHGSPAEGSKRLVAEVLADQFGDRPFRLIDIGCGNGHLYGYFREAGLQVTYTGVDFSEVLLDAAREVYAGDGAAEFVPGDGNTLDGIEGHWDVALYSHVLETLSAPEDSLRAAKRLADSIIVRFFEPPDHDTDIVELRELEIGDGSTVPYIRRKISRDHYRMVLARIGCTAVDVYRDELSTDQVHVLRYGDDRQGG